MISLKQLVDVCSRLNDAGVKYVLVGGWAIFLHGYERATRDIDIVVEPSPANIEKLKEALADFLPDACAEMYSDDVLHNAVVRMAGEKIVVDVMRGIGSHDFAQLSGCAESETIDGISIPFADLDSMIDMKGGLRDVDKRDYLFLEGKREFLKKNRS